MTLPERLQALAEQLDGHEYDMPLLSKEACLEAAAIIDKLPVTADGVPLSIGMQVFDDEIEYTVKRISQEEWCFTEVTVISDDFEDDILVSQELAVGYFSTREAAEKARKG